MCVAVNLWVPFACDGFLFDDTRTKEGSSNVEDGTSIQIFIHTVYFSQTQALGIRSSGPTPHLTVDS